VHRPNLPRRKGKVSDMGTRTATRPKIQSEIDFTSIFPGDGWELPSDFSLDISGILPNRLAIHRATDTVLLLCMRSMNGPDFSISCAGLRWMNDQVSAKAYRKLYVALTTDGMDILFNHREASDLFWSLRTIPPNMGKGMSGSSRLATSAIHQGYGGFWWVSEGFTPVGNRFAR
jgi:hypothetical protein